MTKIKAKIQLRRDTSENFTSINPTLLLGEFAFETDTMVVTEGGSVSVKLKIGDGVNLWSELPYTTFGFQAVTWEDITGKPTEFAPAPHTHEIEDVIGLETILEAIAESIPAAQIQSDWNQTNSSSLDFIKNKPSIPAAQIQSDWTQSNNAALDFIKNKPAIPASGLPAGGTAGQILTKIDGVDYNANWQENFADWTSQVKHIVKNNGLSGTITKGTAVYVTGSNGTNMLVGRASNASESTSSKTMGLMQSDITTTGGNQTGFVITEGLLGGLNTAGQTAGDPVWLGVNGALIYGLTNKPYAPAHLVFIGIVTKVSAGSGEIFVKVQNGFELKEIHDVDLISTAPINGHVLGFDGTLWVNKTIAGWLGFTPEPAIAAGTTSQYWRGDKSWQTLDKIAVGLGNVDNTSDANKPISTATQTALNAKFTLPTLTAGSILFSDGATIAQDNANFFWDNTNSRLGVGTASPVSRLQIKASAFSQPLFNAYDGFYDFNLGYYAATTGSERLSIYKNSYRTIFDSVSTSSAISSAFAFLTNGSEIIRFNQSGNVLIGTTTDAGFKLDVNGGAIIRQGLQVNNPLSCDTIQPRQNQNLTLSAPWADSTQVAIETITNKPQVLIVRPGANLTLASTTHDTQRITHTFAPTSGTAVVNALTLQQTINQTGGANGITRGLYINPTLTAAADFRAIETTRGRIVFGNLPTSSTGLPTGAVWNDAGTLKIV